MPLYRHVKKGQPKQVKYSYPQGIYWFPEDIVMLSELGTRATH
jgi:hypothetical protein